MPRWLPMEEVDVNQVGSHLGLDVEVVGWWSRSPSGRTRVWMSGAGGLVAIEHRLVRAAPAATIRAWLVVGAWGSPGYFDASMAADAPLVAGGPVHRLPDGATRLPCWVSGPDPFVGLQTRLEEVGPDLNALARAPVGRGWSPARDAAYWRWRYFEEPGSTKELYVVRDGDQVAGLIALAVLQRHGVAVVEILEIRALSWRVHYDLLKAARRFSWERGALPVILRGEHFSRRYAFSAGYLRSSAGFTTPHAAWSSLGPDEVRLWSADLGRFAEPSG